MPRQRVRAAQRVSATSGHSPVVRPAVEISSGRRACARVPERGSRELLRRFFYSYGQRRVHPSSARDARASMLCARLPTACGRAWPLAWLPSGACVRASARLWRCAHAAWRHLPEGGPVQGALPVISLIRRCRSSSYSCLRRAKNNQSHTIMQALPPHHLSTEFVHNHVDRAAVERQTASSGKGLHRAARVFANATTNRSCAALRSPCRCSATL